MRFNQEQKLEYLKTIAPKTREGREDIADFIYTAGLFVQEGLTILHSDEPRICEDVQYNIDFLHKAYNGDVDIDDLVY